MKCFKWENQTAVTEFLLLGVSRDQDHRLLFIGLLLILYLLSLFGNIFIMAAANLDSQLQTPMYFFLSNLSFVDICVASVTVPKYIDNLLSKTKSISFLACVMQMYLFIWLVSTENFLLAMMAYDRYEAICNPLHYTTVMSKKLCVLLVIVSWFLTSLHATLYVTMTFQLCFCGPNAIHSFFCDQPPVLELSCSDTVTTHQVILYEGSFVAGLLISFIVGTYVFIIKSILRLRSAQTRQKAFLTCSSHLTVIALFYGTAVSVYFLPPSATSKENNTLVSMIYALVAPMLNPFIYSLRNKEIQVSLKKALRRC